MTIEFVSPGLDSTFAMLSRFFRARPSAAAAARQQQRDYSSPYSLRASLKSRARSMSAGKSSAAAAREGELGGGDATIGTTSSSSPAQPRPPPFPSSSDPQQQQQPPAQLLLAQLTSVQNARDLASAAPPGLIAPGRLFRSACPAGCCEAGVAVLRQKLQIRTLLDLRSDEERRQDPRCLLLHSEGAEVNAFDRAGVGAAPSSSKVEGEGEEGGRGTAFAARKPLHRPTLPLGHVPADDPAPPAPGEPALVVHHVSLLDKERLRKALIQEMPRSSAAAVVALGLLSKALGALPLLSTASSWLGDKSRQLAMDRINEGGLSNVYHCMLRSSDAEIGAALRALLASAERGAPALFFCRVGKDRTGLVAALVLSICGADDAAILDDYVLSDDPGAEQVALGGLERSRDLKGLDTSVFARAPRAAIESALQRLRERHGSVQGYLDKQAGFTLAEQARLRAALAVERPTPAM